MMCRYSGHTLSKRVYMQMMYVLGTLRTPFSEGEVATVPLSLGQFRLGLGLMWRR